MLFAVNVLGLCLMIPVVYSAVTTPAPPSEIHRVPVPQDDGENIGDQRLILQDLEELLEAAEQQRAPFVSSHLRSDDSPFGEPEPVQEPSKRMARQRLPTGNNLRRFQENNVKSRQSQWGGRARMRQL